MTQNQQTAPIIKKVTNAFLKGRRPYVIGDIHGCYQELLALEDRARFNARKHKSEPFFICVGDYCDRGPASKEVIEHVRLGVEQNTHAGVLGNHELYYLQVLASIRLEELKANGVTWPDWLPPLQHTVARGRMMTADMPTPILLGQVYDQWSRNGGKATLASYGMDSSPTPDQLQSVPMEHLIFLLRCPLAITTPFGFVTHALMRRSSYDVLLSYGPDSPQDVVLAAVDDCLWQRKRPNEPPADKLWHFSGHTPTRRVKRSLKNRWLQIDTGCVYGHRLTAIDMETRRSFSVPALQDYAAKSR